MSSSPDRYRSTVSAPAAVDFAHDSTAVIDRAVEIAQRYQAGLTLLHVVEDAALYQGEDPEFFDAILMQKELVERATRQMNAMRDRAVMPGVKTLIAKGAPKHEIVRVADNEKADLIVIGSHGRHAVAFGFDC